MHPGAPRRQRPRLHHHQPRDFLPAPRNNRLGAVGPGGGGRSVGELFGGEQSSREDRLAKDQPLWELSAGGKQPGAGAGAGSPRGCGDLPVHGRE